MGRRITLLDQVTAAADAIMANSPEHLSIVAEIERKARQHIQSKPGHTDNITLPAEPAEDMARRQPEEDMLNQAAQLGSLPKQPNQADYLSSPTKHNACLSSPIGQPNRAAQVSSPTKQPTQTAYLSSLPKQPNLTPVRLEPKSPFFTPAQKAVLRYFQINGSHVASYDIIANDSKVPRGTVRQIVDKMVALGLLDRSQWRQGRNCGLLFTFHGTGQDMQQANPTPQTSSPIQHLNQASQNLPIGEIDREDLNLSISQEDMALHWPNLVRCGFGPDQLAQIRGSLSRIGKPTDRIVQGLDHLEYELANDQLVDKSGQPVADPCSWAFRALAQNGYYRRPKGYVSPEEQAAKDAEEEARAVSLARQKAEQAQFEAWRDSLSPEGLEEAMKGFPGGNKGAWLRKVWKERAKRG